MKNLMIVLAALSAMSVFAADNTTAPAAGTTAPETTMNNGTAPEAAKEAKMEKKAHAKHAKAKKSKKAAQ